VGEENIRVFGALMQHKGEVRLRASGYSMYPYILPGDICRFMPFKTLPAIGQVCLVASDSGILFPHRLHRIIKDQRDIRYIFRGDTNRVYDPSVTPEQVIGILIELKRHKTTLPENRLLRRVWSFVAVRLKTLMLPFVVIGWWKKRFSDNSSTEKGDASWHLIYQRKEKARRY
jgi:hypothetical protein